MCESFTIAHFPKRKVLLDALLAHRDDMIKRIVVFMVHRTGDSKKQKIMLGVTINRIKRVNGKQSEDIWQFTGTLRMSDTYMLEGIDRILEGVPRRYIGGEFSVVKNRLTWSPRSKNIIVLATEEFMLFER